MTFSQIYSTRQGPVLSLEFFPPKENSALEDTRNTMQQLSKLNPAFMTVTYGAGGGTRGKTCDLVHYIHQQLAVPAVAHFTCVGHSVTEINQMLDRFAEKGIQYILALRGDPPKGETTFEPHPEGFQYASDLVAHIAKDGRFNIAVAGYPETHPEAINAATDIENLKKKVDLGGEVIVTQLFFDCDIYFRFVETVRAAGIQVPIIPGILPIRSVSQVQRFTKMCGATIPDTLQKELEKRADNPEEVIRFGEEYALQMALELLEGDAPGLHFYTLNQTNQVKNILEKIQL